MAQSDASTVGPQEARILAGHGIGPEALLGAGGESRVFALDDQRVLRIFHGEGEVRDTSVDDLLDSWGGGTPGVTVPRVLHAGRTGRQNWTVDRRVPGRSLAQAARSVTRTERRRMVASALRMVTCLQRLPVPRRDFGLVAVPGAPGFARLVDLLDERMDAGVAFGGGGLVRLVPDLSVQRARMREALAERVVTPSFVHNDLAPGNVMVDATTASGVVDVSVHALAADPVLDRVGFVCMLSTDEALADEESWAEGILRDQLGDDAWLVDVYRRFYAAYYAMDPASWEWCVRQFERPW